LDWKEKVRERENMLIFKHYFLNDAERYLVEESILASNSRFGRNEVYKMDDKELMTVYNSINRTCNEVG
jgi:hypothetical protein